MDTSGIQWLELTEEYLPQVLAIERRINSFPWSEKSFRYEIAKPYSTFLVATLDNQVVGYGCMSFIIDEAHIVTLAVAPEFQGHGIGTVMMIRLLEMAKKKGMIRSTLEVRASNKRAYSIYLKLGFSSVGIRKNYYVDNREDAITMHLQNLQRWAPPETT